MDYRTRFRAAENPDLAGIDPGAVPDGLAKKKAVLRTERNWKLIADEQTKLYAGRKFAFVIVLQGMDAAGKDSTAKHIVSALNPSACTVTSFKQPSAEEAAHDFLWRIHKAAPPRGSFAIFNRSHYESVLVERVHELVPEPVWRHRFSEINAFESMLHRECTLVVKFFLHISRSEQLERFEERLDNPLKLWKVSPSDYEDRKLWDAYAHAYADVFRFCNLPEAPWFIIPSDLKWARDLVISEILLATLKTLKLDIPGPAFDLATLKRSLEEAKQDG